VCVRERKVGTKKEEGEREGERERAVEIEREREGGREREGEERDALLIHNAAPSSLVQEKGDYFVWLFNNRWRHERLEVVGSVSALVKLSQV
jgi:hypothetical protein